MIYQAVAVAEGEDEELALLVHEVNIHRSRLHVWSLVHRNIALS